MELSLKRRASDVHRLIAGVANPFARTVICSLGAHPDFDLPNLEVGSLKLEGPISDLQLGNSIVGSWKSEVVRSNFQLQTSNFEVAKSSCTLLIQIFVSTVERRLEIRCESPFKL